MLMQLFLTQMNETAQIIARKPNDRHLRALAVAHFVLAFAAGAVSSMSLITAIAFSTSMSGMMGGTAIDAVSLFHFIGAEMALLGLFLSGATAAAGWNLLTRRLNRWGWVLELGTLALFPFGTALALITLIAIARLPKQEPGASDCCTIKAR